MPEPDEFVLFRNALNSTQDGKSLGPAARLLLENQREICAVLALLVRGGHAPIDIARDLQERAKRITKILEAGT